MSSRNPGATSSPIRLDVAAGRAPVRRPPQQDRGQRRYEELLDAAEKVIAEFGVAAMTTNTVAERAGAGMGSLYHFFENKDAIVDALALRYTGAVHALTAYSGRHELRDLPLAGLADALVDPLAEFFRRTPAYRHVFHAVRAAGGASRWVSDLREAVVTSVDGLLAVRVPRAEPRRRRLLALVMVRLVHSMLDFAYDSPAAQRRALLDETKRLLVLYLEMLERGDDPLARLR